VFINDPARPGRARVLERLICVSKRGLGIAEHRPPNSFGVPWIVADGKTRLFWRVFQKGIASAAG
jgi:hypothetical protein